jgi:hypothetical protein
VLFAVGDGTVNAAVDELVRSLPPKTIRRAVVPAAFSLRSSSASSLTADPNPNRSIHPNR